MASIYKGPLKGLGEALRILRKRRRMTQDELASQLGVRNTTISRWEREQGPIGSDALEQLLSTVHEDFAGLMEALALARREPPDLQEAEGVAALISEAISEKDDLGRKILGLVAEELAKRYSSEPS